MEVDAYPSPECAGNSHDGEQFQPLDGTEWETLVWLPVTPKPTTIEVGAKAKGARGISEELERVLSGSKNMATPFREGRKLSHHMTSALAKALRLMLRWSFLTVVDRSIRRQSKSLTAGATLAKESLPMSESSSLLMALCLDNQDLVSPVSCTSL